MTGRIWVCENCDHENPIENDACQECGWDKFAEEDNDWDDWHGQS